MSKGKRAAPTGREARRLAKQQAQEQEAARRAAASAPPAQAAVPPAPAPAPVPIPPVPIPPAAIPPAVTSPAEAPPTLPPAQPPGGGSVLPPGSPSGSRTTARAAQADKSRRTRQYVAAGIAAVLVLAALGWFLTRGGDDTSGDEAPVTVASQQVLLQVVGQAQALNLALLSHGAVSGQPEGASVTFVPSDLQVQVAGYGGMTMGHAAVVPVKNASSNALGDLLGVQIDGTWTLTPAGFAALVDVLGGVEADVDVDVVVGGRTVVSAGPQHLGGAQAVAYSTFRAPGEPEQKRLARFNDVLEDVLAALPPTPADIATLLAGLGPDSQSTVPGKLAALLSELHLMQTDSAVVYRNVPVRLIDSGDQPVYELDPVASTELTDALIAEGAAPVEADSVPVMVRNGVGTPGLGDSARGRLTEAGFEFVPGGNQTPFDDDPTVILIPDASDHWTAVGVDVAAALGVPNSALRTDAVGTSLADVVVILGSDYKP